MQLEGGLCIIFLSRGPEEKGYKMPLKVVRNDITKMDTEAIVNTAASTVSVGAGCDIAIYRAAGYEKLIKVREEIGDVEEGEVFITPGFDLKAKYIIHAVSPYYIDGKYGEEDRLRSCYRKSLALAREKGIRSISFPLISTGSFGYPRAHGLRIAMDEINMFLLDYEMDVKLVVFDSDSTELAQKLQPTIEAFINHKEVQELHDKEYRYDIYDELSLRETERVSLSKVADDYDEELDGAELHARVEHIADPFGVYLLYLSERQGISLTTLENTAWVSKHVVHKVRKNSGTYKPDKRTAFQFCVGLELGLDDTRDLLLRAGYAISPSVLEDRIWEYYIEHEHFDIIDISDALEKYGLKPIVDF